MSHLYRSKLLENQEHLFHDTNSLIRENIVLPSTRFFPRYRTFSVPSLFISPPPFLVQIFFPSNSSGILEPSQASTMPQAEEMNLSGFPHCQGGDVLIVLAPDKTFTLHAVMLRRHSSYFARELTLENATHLKRGLGLTIRYRFDLIDRPGPSEKGPGRFNRTVSSFRRILPPVKKPTCSSPPQILPSTPQAYLCFPAPPNPNNHRKSTNNPNLSPATSPAPTPPPAASQTQSTTTTRPSSPRSTAVL